MEETGPFMMSAPTLLSSETEISMCASIDVLLCMWCVVVVQVVQATMTVTTNSNAMVLYAVGVVCSYSTKTQ